MERRLSNRQRTRQSGYALILMVVGLMGIGGVVIAGFTQGAKQDTEHQRYLHNQRILREAKQALLQYAFNYPQMGPDQDDGPGRLLCPDTDNDNDGLENYVANCAGGIVGRFPWGDPDLNFYKALDASGEELWYAVSSNFGRGPGSVINSASFGGITVEDRSGAMLHDGAATIPAGGVVAVIIAPGAPIARNGATQVRGTADEKRNAANYLDLFGARDNAVFINGDANGFVTGPILDVVSGDLLVNDQMIIVTAAEVIAMAEKATLQAYRKAINEYLAATGNVYPWLYNYKRDPANGLDVGELSSLYPADEDFPTEETDYLSNYGRIPSMFRPYFSEADSGPIESKLSVVISNADLSGDIIYNRIFPSSSTGTYTFVNTIWDGSSAAAGYASINLNEESDEPITDLRFVDDTPGDDVVKLVGTIGADETHSLGFTIWFWSRNDIGVTEWAQCAGALIESCHVNSFYLPVPYAVGEQAIQILKVEVELFFDSADDVEFELDLSNLPDPRAPLILAADGTNHAWIGETFAAVDVVSNAVIQIRYEWDDNYTDANWDVDESGTLDFASIGGANLQLGLRYYPELPNWMETNGWHDAIRMAYAPNFKPDIAGGCTVLADDCLEITDAPGGVRDKIALLVIAGENDWDDDDASGLDNDEGDVFDAENFDGDESFLLHEGNDEILVIEEL